MQIRCTHTFRLCIIKLKQQREKDNTLTLLNQFGLSNRVSYSYLNVANAFIGSGYISQAGNLYFNSLRLLDGIVIKEDVGQGYSRTFLNGLRIFDIKLNNPEHRHPKSGLKSK
jgi:hypothetical protein